MSVRIGVIRAGEQSAETLAAASRASLDRPLAHVAELWVALARDEGVLVGAFQRGVGLPGARLFRRGSGGAEAHVGPGTVHVVLSLARPDALVACDEHKIVNRYVRPLLRALGACGAVARYFGRDWVSVGNSPVASVGFAHDTTTRRTAFEAVVAMRVPHATRPRESFRGGAPTTIDAAVGKEVDPQRVADAVIRAYADAYGAETSDEGALAVDPSTADDPTADPPWRATVEEVIGTLGAGPDRHARFRVGGDLLVSRDALARLEERVASLPGDPGDEEIGRAVDEALGARGVALEGVRSLLSVRDVISRALRR